MTFKGINDTLKTSPSHHKYELDIRLFVTLSFYLRVLCQSDLSMRSIGENISELNTCHSENQGIFHIIDQIQVGTVVKRAFSSLQRKI